MPSLALLRNPDSGSGEAGEAAAILRAHGAEVWEFDVGEFREAAASGADRVVVAGGDGSIAGAAEAAGEAGIELAVVPAGTANDFADRMEIPADLADACRVAAEGTRTREVDLAWIGGRPFVNVASLGLPPAAGEAAGGLKEKLGPVAYSVGAVRAGATADPVRCAVSCERGPLHEGEAWQVTVACSGAFGGGSRIDADADDGKLDVVVIEAGSRLRLPKHAYGLRTGSVEDQKGVDSARCSSVAIDLAPDESFNVDGEIVAAGELESNERGISFRIRRRAFRLVIG
jgi:diacylglycerol kinase family enzyme